MTDLTTIQFVPASDVSLQTLTDTFNAAYEGYIMPVNVTPQWMEMTVTHGDLMLKLSSVAMLNNSPVGLYLLGKRHHHGWIGGVGVALPHRRKGIGKALMERAIETAAYAGITQLDLEVIIGNDGAYALYQALGFKTTRKLLILTRDAAPLPSPPVTLRVEDVSIDDITPYYEAWHPKLIPWQRQIESLKHHADDYSVHLAYRDEQPVAYTVFRMMNDVIALTDFAFTSGADDYMESLLIHLHQTTPTAPGRIINIGEDDPAAALLLKLGYTESIAQYEMRLVPGVP